ncbi:MAG TPA: transglycosylase domain-containing protein [Thermoanaerobaculia bacterium]|jgi:hypothetical protein
MRKVFAVIAIWAAILLLLVLWFAYSRFYRYQADVERVVASITAEERGLSAEARDVFVTLEGESLVWTVSRGLLGEVAPARVRMSEWHLRGLLWSVLLPRRVSDEELLLLYARLMAFEEGRGVVYGARRYFGKTPAQLTADDAIALTVIARSPRLYSPTHRPRDFKRMVALKTRQYCACRPGEEPQITDNRQPTTKTYVFRSTKFTVLVWFLANSMSAVAAWLGPRT